MCVCVSILICLCVCVFICVCAYVGLCVLIVYRCHLRSQIALESTNLVVSHLMGLTTKSGSSANATDPSLQPHLFSLKKENQQKQHRDLST